MVKVMPRKVQRDTCPGCGESKIVTSARCKKCWASDQYGEGHNNWKGGKKDTCPSCGDEKLRGSDRCRRCAFPTTETGEDPKERANRIAREYLKTPQGVRYVRAMNLKKYGITPEEYDSIWEKQSGVCASCGNEETHRNQFGVCSLAVDHDHTTGVVRGLLCGRCNRALGLLRDSADVVQSLLNYRRSFE